MGNKRKSKKSKGRNNSESEAQNSEEKCNHVKDCTKLTNLKNTVPHADLTKCQDCSKLDNESSVTSGDKKSESCESGESELDLTQNEEKPGICVCLRCGNIGCSRQSADQHAILHYNSNSNHPLVVNLTNWVIWCYKCDNEVDVEVSSVLGDSLVFLKKALGVKAAKQEKRTQQPGKQKVSKVSGKATVVKGLANLGNTCFFNSVMQNLCQSQLLRVTMNHLSEEFEYSIFPAGDKLDLDPISVQVTDKPGPLTSALEKFLQDMSSEGKKQVVSPGYLFTEICKKAPRFKGFRQQDSQELLRYLLDSVRTEEIKGVKRAILRSFGVKSVANGEGISADKVDEEIHEKIRVYGRNARAPIIDTLFGGHLVSSVECRACHKVSTMMESFFDLSLSLATNNNITPKQQDTTPATKKKQPPAPVAEKNTTKKVEKRTDTKPNPPIAPSKYQTKKKAKERKKNKRKGRKRHNSTSSTGRKQSETGEDDEADDDDEENLNDDVTETLNDDVTEIPNDDVTEIPNDDVTETPNDNVTGTLVDDVTGTLVDDVTGTLVDDVANTSVEKSVTVKENQFMNLAKVTDNERKNRGTSTLSSEEELCAAVKALNISKDEENLEGSNITDSTTKDEIELDVLSQERVEKSRQLVEYESNGNQISVNENCKIPVETNDICSKIKLQDSDDSGNGKIGCVDVLNGQKSLKQSNEDVLSSTDEKLQNCQNNKTCSENLGRENNYNGCDDNTGYADALDHKNCVNKSSLHTEQESLSNCVDKKHEKSYTTKPTCHEVNRSGDANCSSVDDNKISLCVVDDSEEQTKLKSETSNSTTEMKDIRVNSVENESRNGAPDGIASEKSTKIRMNKGADSITGRTLQDNPNTPYINYDKSTPSHETPTHINTLEDAPKTDKFMQNEPSNSSPNYSGDSPEEPASLNTAINSETNTCLPDKLSNLSLNEDTENFKENRKDMDNCPTQDLSPQDNNINSNNEIRVPEIENESKNFITDHPTVLSSDVDIKKSKERADVLAYVDRITDDTLKSCFQNISTASLPEATEKLSKTEVGPDSSVESKKLEEGLKNPACNISPEKTDFKTGCLKSNVDEHPGGSTSLSLDQNDYEKIKEYVGKIVQNAFNLYLDRNSSTSRDNGLSKIEDISQEKTSKCGEIETESSIDSKDLEMLDTATVARSEILCGNHSLGNMEAIKSNATSVENCLKRFCTPEILEGSNMFICEQCNQHKDTEEDKSNEDDEADETNDKDSSKKKTKRKPIYTEAVKQLLIHQAPPILTLHLKRFHQVGFSLKKIGKHVDFPLVLDLAPFCHKSGKFATDAEGQVLYSLFGLVEHSGGMNSGHYTAYCRVPTAPSSLFETKFETLTQLLKIMDQMWTLGGKRESCFHEELPGTRWFHISDSHVSEVGLERVLKANAYLLFYERMVLSYGGGDEDVDR